MYIETIDLVQAVAVRGYGNQRGYHHAVRRLLVTPPLRHHVVVDIPAVGFALRIAGTGSRSGNTFFTRDDVAGHVAEHCLPLPSVRALNPHLENSRRVV